MARYEQAGSKVIQRGHMVQPVDIVIGLEGGGLTDNWTRLPRDEVREAQDYYNVNLSGDDDDWFDLDNLAADAELTEMDDAAFLADWS